MSSTSLIDATAAHADAEISESEARRHLESVLASAAFSKTKRHARFLRFVVDKTFAGHADEIKERTLGIEIFDRNPGYDLSDDPIVRVTAGDIRKRLLQYYRDEGEHERLRLELPTGSYVPVFRQRPAEKVPAPQLVSLATESEQVLPSKHWKHWMVFAFVLSTIAMVLLGVFSWSDWHIYTKAERDLHQFWEPLEVSPDSVIRIVVGDLNALHKYTAPSLPEPFRSQLGSRAVTGPGNTYALAELADYAGSDHQNVQTYMSDNVNLSDLRAQPSILIGAFDNIWTARLLEGERFTMQQDLEKHLVGIRDSTHPDGLRWQKNDGSFDTSNSQDFALVTRKRSPLTGQMFLSVCGVGSYGTVAAAEFLTHPEYFQQFVRIAPTDWKKKDLQIVIAVNVVDGRTSPPTVLSYSFE